MKARHLPVESADPGSDLCTGCGLPPWADTHLTVAQERTAAARKARHLNALQRKADVWAEGLRELGYVVLTPSEIANGWRVTSDPVGEYGYQDGMSEGWGS